MRKTFQISAGRFRLSRFCFSDSNFQVSAGKFQFSRFSFSSVYCQIPTFRLLLAIPIFTLLLCKFSASYKLHFQIGITCVISAQLPHNVSGLCVRAGFRSTKVDIITKVQLKNYTWILHFSPPDAKPLLVAVLFYFIFPFSCQSFNIIYKSIYIVNCVKCIFWLIF